MEARRAGVGPDVPNSSFLATKYKKKLSKQKYLKVYVNNVEIQVIPERVSPVRVLMVQLRSLRVGKALQVSNLLPDITG
jgi:hypothetical protein